MNADRRASILLVDDEAVIVRLMGTALTKRGFYVRSACSGADAIRVADKMDSIDVVVTDSDLGRGIGGRDIVLYLREEYPQLKALYMSGAPPAAELDSWESFLQKPFMPEELVRHVEGMLGRTLTA